MLNSRVVLGIIFQNGCLVFYEVFLSGYNTTEVDLSSIRMKKILVDYMDDLDYKDFFYSNFSNSLIRFTNISGYSGVFLNISGKQSFLFDINGKLKRINLDNPLNKSYSGFSEISLDNLNGK